MGEEITHDQIVYHILCNEGIDNFVEDMNDHNPNWSRQVVTKWNGHSVLLEGCHFSINPKLIKATIGIVNSSRRYNNDMRTSISKI